MAMPGRSYPGASSADYRFGHNGQEKDNEVFEGAYTAEFWEYDSRSGRRWNIDPIVKHWESPYATFLNNPILHSDASGLDADEGEGGGDDNGKGGCKGGKNYQPDKSYPHRNNTGGNGNDQVNGDKSTNGIGLGAKILNGIKNIGNAIVKGIANAITKIGNFITNTWHTAGEAIGNAFSRFDKSMKNNHFLDKYDNMVKMQNVHAWGSGLKTDGRLVDPQKVHGNLIFVDLNAFMNYISPLTHQIVESPENVITIGKEGSAKAGEVAEEGETLKKEEPENSTQKVTSEQVVQQNQNTCKENMSGNDIVILDVVFQYVQGDSGKIYSEQTTKSQMQKKKKKLQKQGAHVYLKGKLLD